MSGIIDSVGMKSGVIGSDVYSAGHIYQMFNVHSIAAQTIAGSSTATVTGLTKTFNRIRGNSHFICQTQVICATNDNQENMDDVDPSLAFVVNSSIVDTNTNLIWDGFYASYVPAWRVGGTYSGRYDTFCRSCSVDMTHISSGSNGDSVTIAVQARSNHNMGFYINRSQAATDNGAVSSLTIFEVA